MRLLPLAVLAAGAATASSPSAQATVPFPLDPAGRDAATDAPLVRADEGLVRLLADLDAVRLAGLPLPAGGRGEAVLERVRHEDLGFGFVVDGVARPDLFDGLDLSVWTGAVASEPGSEVVLSFSAAGSRGWVRTARGTLHVLPQPDDAGSWRGGEALLLDEDELLALGARFDFACGLDELPGPSRAALDGTPDGTPRTGPAKAAASTSLYECRVAVETDWQLNQVFGGDLGAETAYVTSLLSAVSDRYVEQISTVLTFPYLQLHTSSNDGWSTPDSGGSSVDMLIEFAEAWQGNLPVEAELAHFLSGANLGGGVAYLSVLCDDANDWTFAVSGNIEGAVSFPVAVSPMNWDYFVVAHEIGHNFGSPHTHDYCPPLDECAPVGFWGACQDEVTCTSSGTIMSYCHQCEGGLANVTTYFHPTVVANVQDDVETCLALAIEILASPPAVVPPGVPTTLTAQVKGSPVGPVELHWRLDPADAFQAVAMTPQGGDQWAGDLPAPSCGDQPEVFFAFTDATAGPVQSETYTPAVGLETVTFADDFDADLGWTVGGPADDATTGIWERGDPIATSAQPGSGHGSPDCYFTGQGSPGGNLGENDVDGGQTTLTSPAFDLSGADARVSYWRWYSNDTGSSPASDVFLVEISADGSSWTTVESVGPGGPEASGGWYYQEFRVADFVTPSAAVRVRFVASDEGSGSLVEAAIDEFQVARVSCEVCADDLGFGGGPTLTLCGDPLTPAGTADLALAGAPGSSAAFFGWSTSFAPTPALGGTLVPVPILGVLTATTDGSGAASLEITGGAPAPTPIFVQSVTIDAGTGGFAISNAIEAELLP